MVRKAQDESNIKSTSNMNYNMTGEPDKLKIVVLGVGGAGSNAVDNMIRNMSSRTEDASVLEQVSFWSANTDSQALSKSLAPNKLQLGLESTKGLGAGSNPELGKIAAEESMEQLRDILTKCHMLFITAGMGGGTGTGAAPVIARLAMEMGVLTVGVVTKPFHFEGHRRMKVAEEGLHQLSQNVDALIVIPNQNLFLVVNEKTTFAEAFKIADSVLEAGVLGITDLVIVPGVINLDFADIKSVMKNMGNAMLGIGISNISPAEGLERAVDAAEKAITNPLLDKSSTKGAKALLINVSGGDDMTLFEVDAAITIIKREVDPNANLIFGSSYDPNLQGAIKVVVVATGINSEKDLMENLLANKTKDNVHPITSIIDDISSSNQINSLYVDDEEQDLADYAPNIAPPLHQNKNISTTSRGSQNHVTPLSMVAENYLNRHKNNIGNDSVWPLSGNINDDNINDEEEKDPATLLNSVNKMSYFIPPDPVEPESYRQFPSNLSGTNKDRSAGTPVPKREELAKHEPSPASPKNSLLSRVTKMIRQSAERVGYQNGRDGDDRTPRHDQYTEIPTFLRRKNNDEKDE